MPVVLVASWSVSIPITVVYNLTGRTQKGAQILLYGYCVAAPISYFYKMAQVKTICMTGLPVFRL